MKTGVYGFLFQLICIYCIFVGGACGYDIASLLKMSSNNQTEDTKPQLGESGGKKKEKEEKREERKETEKTESGSCPLCQQSFPLYSLPDHAADCQGAPSSQPTRSVLVHSRLPSNRPVSV